MLPLDKQFLVYNDSLRHIADVVHRSKHVKCHGNFQRAMLSVFVKTVIGGFKSEYRISKSQTIFKSQFSNTKTVFSLGELVREKGSPCFEFWILDV
jgi:hypothetical protein